MEYITVIFSCVRYAYAAYPDTEKRPGDLLVTQ